MIGFAPLLFQVLCALLAVHGQYYKAGVAADMIQFLHNFELDSNSPVIQVYLQLCKYYINDLSLDRIIKVGTIGPYNFYACVTFLIENEKKKYQNMFAFHSKQCSKKSKCLNESKI